MIIKQPGKENIPQLRKLWKEAFGDTDAFLDTFFATAFAPERCRCVELEGQVAGALYWFSCQCEGQTLAYIYGVATARRFRGQGICRKLMADTHIRLQEQGYAGALLVPGDVALRRMYRVMGYEDMTKNTRFSCQAGEKISLEQISADRYAALRREHLPQNAVLQEGENLRFLETAVQFYKGEDVLFCAVAEEDRLVVPEFLGNTKAAPGVVAALACREGVFTVPGENEPYAMGIGFSPAFQKPAYFAFAFE